MFVPQLIAGSLFLPVDPDESTWEYTSGRNDGCRSGPVTITLYKKLHREWPQIVLKNEAADVVVVQPTSREQPPARPPASCVAASSSPGTKATTQDGSAELADVKARDAHHKRWDGFDIDEAVMEMENEGIEDENDVTWKMRGGGSGITCEDYKKTKEEVELDREIADKMGSLKLDLNKKMNHAARHKQLGNEALQRGRLEEAFSQYKQGMGLLDFVQYSAPVMAPRMLEMVTQLQLDLNNNAAQAALKLKQWDVAQICASEALKLDPKNVKALYRLGTAKQEQGETKEATECMQKVLELDPSNKAAGKALASLRGA